MMRDRILHLAIWFVSRFVPAAQREALMGDLTEEYALRASASSSSAALRWCLRQALASAPPLVWTIVTRSVWISTAGVALLAYVAVGAVELAVNRVFAMSSAYPSAAYNPLGMVATFPLVVLIGYCAAGLRRRAPIVLGAMMLFAVTLMTFSSTEAVPAWYRAAYFVVGPAAALIGKVWHSRRRIRS
jgi:hypothetical protein